MRKYMVNTRSNLKILLTRTPCFQSRCRTMGTRTKSSEVARRQYFFPLREDLLNLTNISNLGTRDIYTAFASQADYEFVLNYAKELDVVIRENNAKRCFLGPLKGHSNIKGFIERRRLGASSGVVRLVISFVCPLTMRCRYPFIRIP